MIHPRTRIVAQARLELDKFLLDLAETHELTYGELFSMLGRAIMETKKGDEA